VAVGTGAKLEMDPGWRDLVLFYEFYNPDTGRGHGARSVVSVCSLCAVDDTLTPLVKIMSHAVQNKSSPPLKLF